MKKIIIILSVLFCTSGIYSQTFKEFFANNCTNGNLDSKYYRITSYYHNDHLTIDLSNQNLTDLEGLDIISIQNRSITYFNILELFLTNNQLTSLPQEISKLTNLRTLYLQNNQLTSLPDTFNTPTNLTHLVLSNNKLTSLPDSFGSLFHLWELNLSNNNLTSLPATFNKLTNLGRLFLSNNKLTSLPDNFGGFPKLWKLNLSNNKIISLPDTLNNLTYLEYLNLNNNPLITMPLSLLEKPNLKYSLNDTPLGAALYYSKLKNASISDSRPQPILVSSFYHNYYENEKLNLSDFKPSFALELIKKISSLLKAKTPKAGSYNPMSRMTLPITTIKEQFNKQRTKKRKTEETESVEYQLPQEIIRNIYTYLD